MTLHILYRTVCKVCWDIHCGGVKRHCTCCIGLYVSSVGVSIVGGEMTLHMLYRSVCKVCWDIYCGGVK